MNPEIMLSDGKVFDLFDPDPELLDIRVIARALSRQCRYNGHSKRFYSVAEHSVLVSALLPNDLRLWGLLHDAAEAFIGDMSSPLKKTPLMAGFRLAESVIEAEILQKFGVTKHGWRGDLAADVKRADLVALAIEVQEIAPGSPADEYWRRNNVLPDPVPPPWDLGLNFDQAESFFLERFEEVS